MNAHSPHSVPEDIDGLISTQLDDRDVILLQLLLDHFLSDVEVRATAYWWWTMREPNQSLVQFLTSNQILLRSCERMLNAALTSASSIHSNSNLFTVHGLAMLREELQSVVVPPPTSISATTPAISASAETQPQIIMPVTVPSMRLDPATLPMPGTQLGDCLITERFDSFGSVGFRALHRTLNLPVTLYLLPPEYPLLPAHARRDFRDGLLKISQHQHPNLIRVWDVIEGQLNYLILEYVEGITLAELIRQSGRMIANRALRLMNQIADTLKHLHQHGMVHGMLDSSSILVTREGHAKLSHAGLMLLRERFPGISLPQTERSPGQSGPWTPADDLYSLGLCMYQALTGNPHEPFRPIVISSQRTPEVLELTALLQRLLTPRISDRFPDAAQLQRRIQEIDEQLQARNELRSGSKPNILLVSSDSFDLPDLGSSERGRQAPAADSPQPGNLATPAIQWKSLPERFGRTPDDADESA
ncbi:serine/threonine protein kinase [Tuwongella immobilis]|uniref:Protein kinase domain-containing protein n=1 Tax=Tuwongella immobilis TaxID=692036 RepID=A0A6C2YKM8_9BACT|nr:protein kinase [Tuwongella immobilis]VIP01861.1 protein kinase : Serine/threonine protein kinase OS=Isosphaera pallida (strain ATCC 43644 / DSM 9630 / IS1B) GN=Isop_2224 PE=4 SV=1: Pkinase [Tuwongella immobilis]VTR99671.1 protein kinase : Serine/threonine protein kinase OS=Isosphaera pallida (strain ATCC 43644 / DSM 9630 / IS1B) GN=Isop_2224 PE=4 SV=1: Pkinase [Tuwongella immobilis]